MSDAIPFEPGQSTPRIEDQRFLTGRGQFVADVNRAGQVHASFVRSPHAHADIVAIPIDDALAAPGVLGIHTVHDLLADGLRPLPCPAVIEGHAPLVVPPRHALALDRVRHAGEPVAMVVARSAEAARDAAELVVVEYRELDAVADPRAALAPGAPSIWPQCPGNLAFDFRKGDAAAVDAALAGAAHRVSLDLINNRVCAAPIETRAGVAEYDAQTGRFSLFCNGQGLHGIHQQLARDVFGLPLDRFHLSAPDVGGGFGLKNFLFPEWVLLPWAARRHGRPVRWLEERGEQFAAAVHGRDMWVRCELGLDTDGRFLALRADIVADMGAYLSGGAPNVSTKACPTAMGGVYDIADICMTSRGAYTNTACLDAYRGAGKPEANYIIERLVDAAARRYGFDPLALRRRNAFEHYPHRTAFGLQIDSGQVHANLDRIETLLDRSGFERRREAAAEQGLLRGQGFGCFLETSRGAPHEGASVRCHADGTVALAVGTESQGQGHETAYTQVAARHLGIGADRIRYVQADTDATRVGFGHGGARSMHMGGRALVEALDGLIEQARDGAARLLQANPAELEFAQGAFSPPGAQQSVSLAEAAAAAEARDDDGSLESYVFVEDAPFTFPNGCHGAEVIVDPQTGHVELVAYAMADDYGALVNPMLTAGQVHGGVVQGIGQALGELVVYDARSAQLISGSFMDYFIPRAATVPAFSCVLDGTPTRANPLGVKGSGQAGAIAAPQTVVNAVLDALAPTGVDHVDMPLSAESLWQAIRAVDA